MLAQPGANRFDLDPVDELSRECIRQQRARLRAGDAARAQVEHRVRVHLAHRGAVRALHVVGVDLELRLGVDHRGFREQQVLVALDGIGLLRFGPHDDAAVEDALALAVQDSLVEFVAGGVRLGVVERGVIVHVLAFRW